MFNEFTFLRIALSSPLTLLQIENLNTNSSAIVNLIQIPVLLRSLAQIQQLQNPIFFCLDSILQIYECENCSLFCKRNEVNCTK